MPTLASTPDAGRPADRIRSEQIRLVYRHLPAIIAVYTASTAILVFGLWAVVPRARLIAWAGVSLLVIVLYAASGRAYWRASSSAPPSVWSAWLVIWAGVFGLLFAAGSLYFYPHGALEHRVLLLITCVGLAAGGTTILSAFLPALYVHLPLSLVPLAVRFIYEGDRVHVAVGIGTLVYVAALVTVGRTVNRVLTDYLALRFENIDLVQQLSRQRDEAERANVAKSKFLAAASHDLRQPLHALTLFASVLDERIKYPEVRKIVESINASVGALEKLFNALLDVSRLDAGVLQPSRRHFRLQELCGRLVHDYAPEAEAKGMTLAGGGDDVTVHTDPALLERILRNYLSNAVRYTEAGQVRLAWASLGDQVRIDVADTGIGIPSAHQREIFDEFYQLGNPERDRTKGLGLGLAIVDRVARLLGHAIEVRSEPGQGSCFSVTVPLGDPTLVTAEKPPRAEAVSNELAGLRALVVDDEVDVREGMRTLLEQWGCQVTLAGSEDEAIRATRTAGAAPDAIIVDYRLRDHRTGAQAIEKLRDEFGAGIPALIVTGDTAAERLREAKASGFQLVYKPVPPAMLRAFLRNARSRKRAS